MSTDLPTGWKISQVKDIAAPGKYSCIGGPFGSNLTLKDYVETPGVPVSRGSNLCLGTRRFLDEDFVFVSEEKAASMIQNTAYPNDLVFTQRGTIGQVAWIPKDAKYPKYILSQNQMKLTPDPKKADVGYLCYYFLSPLAQDLIAQNSIGSTIPGFNLTQLRNFPIILPPLPTQHRIAQILGRLDDKIELNRRLNRTLEAMAQALFKHHFVDFGPYREGEFVESELGSIPRGWEVGRIEDWGKVITGKTPSKRNPSNFNGDVPFIKIPDMHGKVFVTRTTDSLSLKGANSQRNKFLPSMTICVSCIATPGLVCLTSTECQTNQQINSIIPKRLSDAEFIYCQMSEFGEQIRRLGSGGTATLNLNKRDFSNMRVIIPPRNILERFHKQVNSWFKRILNNDFENAKLAEVRDYLLPKLLRGEIEL